MGDQHRRTPRRLRHTFVTADKSVPVTFRLSDIGWAGSTVRHAGALPDPNRPSLRQRRGSICSTSSMLPFSAAHKSPYGGKNDLAIVLYWVARCCGEHKQTPVENHIVTGTMIHAVHWYLLIPISAARFRTCRGRNRSFLRCVCHQGARATRSEKLQGRT